ncbi:uncharacterized protein LOC135347907 isoform X5 [Halichondria panicea]|uniref:uncharacterized protein LOC135347907 isoform X5 n=1 Tax=Halichondria panicea TaxID=6063 RepID=UPI00312B8703
MSPQSLRFYIDLVVIFYVSSQLAVTEEYSVNVERPCPMETVTFTCIAAGNLLRWEVSDSDDTIEILSTSDLNVPIGVSGYTVTLIAFNDTTLTSTLSRTAESVITVSCVGLMPVGTIGSITIRLVDPPGPPSTTRHSTSSNSADEVSVTVDWNPPTETGGRDDLTYTVTISPLAQLSATVLTSTSVNVTAQYNVDYTVSVVATNCAGNSTTADYNFTIGSCPVLINPMNGAFGPTTNSLPGSTVTIQCDAGYVSAVTMVTCEGTLMWSPDPEAIECTLLTTPTPTIPPMSCTTSLSPPQNGTISNRSAPAIPGTQVTFQCDDGLFPEGILTATCLVTGMWDKNPGEIICRNESISCALPAPLLYGALLNTNFQNTNLMEGSVITFQCDPGFSLVGAVTATCNNSGLWDPDPAVLRCVAAPTGGNVAAIAGGVAGGIMVALLLILLIIIILLVVLRKRKESVRHKSNDSIEMDHRFDVNVMCVVSVYCYEPCLSLQGEYSALQHNGPVKNSKKPPAADEEGYNRITHNNPASQNPASLTYDEVILNSDKKIAVNEEGYSVMDTGQGAQRMPGYGQLGNVATVEPVIYAALSTSQPRKKGTATVDHHQVTYATVDSDATIQQEAKAAILPTASAPALPDVDKLLDIDQALVQIRSMQHKWRELAETMRVPETMIEQIEDSCGINHGGCLTEVIDQWMRSCSGRPTWRELAGHLHNIGEEQLSQELMTIYDTGRLPVELNMKAVPSTVYKYDRAPPPPLPSRSPTTTDDDPGLPKLPSRPPKAAGAAMVPARPPKSAHNNEPPVPARPSKQYAKH